MKDRNEKKQFTFSEIKSFLDADIKRKLRAETAEISVAATTSTFSSKSSSRHDKDRYVKKNFKPPSRFRHGKEDRPISPLTTYSRIIKSIFSPSQFYQQQSSEPAFEPASAVDFAPASAIGAFAATNPAFQSHSLSSNSNMPSQFQQSAAYNLFSSQSIGPAASSQQ